MPRELTRSVIVGEELPPLPPGYSDSEGRIALNDNTAELQSDSEVESDYLQLLGCDSLYMYLCVWQLRENSALYTSEQGPSY